VGVFEAGDGLANSPCVGDGLVSIVGAGLGVCGVLQADNDIPIMRATKIMRQNCPISSVPPIWFLFNVGHCTRKAMIYAGPAQIDAMI